MPSNYSRETGGTSEDTRTIVTVLLLIFIFPVGLLLMWFWTKWKLWVKLLVTLPLLLVVVVCFSVGFLATINPRLQVIRAECVKLCGSTDTTCVSDCIQEKTE